MLLYPSSNFDTLPKLFLHAVQTRGNQVAFREKDFGIWQEITWTHYYQHVRDFSLGLVTLGLKRGTRVCIQGENNLEWVIADMAIQAAGGITVGVYPTNPAHQVLYLVNDAAAEFFISTDQEHVDKILEVRDRLPNLRYIICIDMKGVKQYQDPMILGFKEVEERGSRLAAENPEFFLNLVAQGTPDDHCVFIYTSGTTGDPKGAIISQRNVLESGRCILEVIKLTERDQHLSFLPLCHALERTFALCLHVMAGYVVNFAESTDTVQRDIQEVAPTFFISVPRILEKIEASIKIKIDNSSKLKRQIYEMGLKKGYSLVEKFLSGRPLSFADRFWRSIWNVILFRPIHHFIGLARARYVFSGGAPLSPEVCMFFHTIGIPVRELFGMTELTTITCLHQDDKIKVGTIGKVIPGWELQIADDGELRFRGPGVFQGYFGRPEATAEVRTPDGWLCTGDLAEMDRDGEVRIIGRKKDIIITSGGKNISPQEIENALKGSPYIREAVAVGDGKNFIGALIQIELDVVGNWAQNNGIAYATIRDLSHHPKVIQLIREEVKKANAELARVEQVKKFVLIDKELYHEEGDLTATLKTRRAFMQRKFASLINEIYSKDGNAISV